MSTQRLRYQDRGASAWIPLVLVLALILVGFGVWSYFSTRPQPAQVARRDVISTVELDGKTIVPPSARADIRATYQAPVEKVDATVGQRVRKGDVLVELYFPSVQAARDQAGQRLKLAEAAYRNAQVSYGSQEQIAQKQLADARLALAQARQDAGISPGQAGPEPANQAKPEAALQAQQQAELALTQAQADLEGNLAPYQQEVNDARAAVQQATAGERAAQIRAPISGTVLALNAQPGAQIGGDLVVATIVNLDALLVQAQIDSDQAGVVKPGTPASLTFNNIPDRQFSGRVRMITTQAASKLGGLLNGQKYVALVSFRNDRGLVKPDMDASVSIVTGIARDVLAVPNDAVQADPTGRPIVSVLVNGRWQTVVVEPGLRGRDYTEIKAGLNEGQIVQVTPSLAKAFGQAGRRRSAPAAIPTPQRPS